MDKLRMKPKGDKAFFENDLPHMVRGSNSQSTKGAPPNMYAIIGFMD